MSDYMIQKADDQIQGSLNERDNLIDTIAQLEQQLADSESDWVKLRSAADETQRKLAESEKLVQVYGAENLVLHFKKVAEQESIKLLEAEKVIRFYADIDNWSDATISTTSKMIGPDDHEVTGKHQGLDLFNAGKRAREFLKKHEATNG